MFCWKALIDIVCVCFFFFLVISAIVWWLSKSIEHVFELHKIRTSQIFHHQSTYWFVSMMRFFSSFFPFVIILMKCRFVYIFHSHGIAVVSRLVPLPSVWMFTIVQLHHRYFFCGLWFYRHQVNEINKTRRMIALSKKSANNKLQYIVMRWPSRYLVAFFTGQNEN